MMSRKEWTFVAVISAVVIVVTFLPIVMGYFLTPPDKVFLFRDTINGRDNPVYYSHIEQVKAGNILFKDLFTSEFQEVGMLSPFWLLVGFVAKVFNLSAFVAFHLARLVLIPIFCLLAYKLCAFFLEEPWQRKIGCILMIFASGWTWQAVASESFSFAAMDASAHSIASLILLLLIFLYTAKICKNYHFRYSFIVCICSFLLFSFHPYHVPTVLGITGAFVIVDWWRNKKLNVSYVKHIGALLLFSLPAIVYYFWVINYISVRQGHFLQNVSVTPWLPMLVFSYGLLLPLASIGIFSLVKKREKAVLDIFLLTWFFAQLALLYLPIKTQFRLTEGWQFANALLITHAIWYVKNTSLIKGLSYHKFLLKGAFLLGMVSLSAASLYIVANNISLCFNDNSYLYLLKDEKAAMVWLKNTPLDAIILSRLETGNIIPVFSLHQVFLGHQHETVQFDKKQPQVDRFFTAQTSQERQEFLKENNITYLFFGPQEKTGANFNPDSESYLEKVYQNNSVTIYQTK